MAESFQEAVAKELREKQEQKRRLECLLHQYCKASDMHFSDAQFLKAIVRRWAVANNLIVSLGVVE